MEIFCTTRAFDQRTGCELKDLVFATYCKGCQGSGVSTDHDQCARCMGVGRIMVRVYDGDQVVKPRQN